MGRMLAGGFTGTGCPNDGNATMTDNTYYEPQRHQPPARRQGLWVRCFSLSARRRIHAFVIRYIAPIARHPAMTVITGLGLFLSGAVEAFTQIFTDFESVIGAREGVILLGGITFLKGLADMVEASEWLSKGIDEEDAAARNAKA
jgi:uncharacterized membrane protein